MYPSLRIISGKRAGTIYELRDESIILGRSPTCEIVVPEEAAVRAKPQLLRCPCVPPRAPGKVNRTVVRLEGTRHQPDVLAHLRSRCAPSVVGLQKLRY